jgi:hypothetical protein
MASVAQTENIDVGRVVQRGFSAIGRNAAGFLLMAVVFAGLPNFAMNYVLAANLPTIAGNPFDGSYWGTYAGLLLLTVFAGYLLQATVVRMVILDLSGRRPDLGGSLVAALALVLPMIGLAIVSGIGIMLGLMLLIVPGVILYVMWIVAVPILVEERRGVFGSLSRSSELTRGSRWQIFGLVVLFIIFSFVISAVFGLLNIGDPFQSPELFALSSAVVAVISGLVMAAMLASLYFELRTVKEGATSDSLAAIFE